jgi:hypothetical protein
MLVRDEEDILPETIPHLLRWIDGLYVLDLGSTDTTWQIIEEFARKDRRVVPFKSQPIIYHDSLRCILFEKYRDRFRDGDWICKVDADEFYQVPPPQFVRERVQRGETAIWLQWYYFRLTSKEVEDYESGRVSLVEDRARPIADRRRFYKIPEYAEPRMFRYRSSMRWPATASFPYNAGFVARERIPIRHYPHRDPMQMQQRYRLRSLMMQVDPNATGPHWKLADWRQDVIRIDPVSGVATEQNSHGVGLAAAGGHTAGQLNFWAAGEQLPEVHTAGHLAKPPKRTLQRIIHPLCLPILDRLHRGLPKDFEPRLIPDAIMSQLRNVSPDPLKKIC